MKIKLKKISLSKDIISNLDDYEMARIQGGLGSASLYDCFDVSSTNGPPKTSPPKTNAPIGGMTSGTGVNPDGAGCNP